jgi:hypothetical protein
MPFDFQTVDNTINPAQLNQDANTDTSIVKVGNALYMVAQTGEALTDKKTTLMYKRDLSGVFWSALDTAHSPVTSSGPGGNSAHSLFTYLGQIYFIWNAGSPAGAFRRTQFDPGTDTWGATTNLPFTSYQTAYGNHGKFFGRYRPDGSFILVHQSQQFDGAVYTSLSNVAIEKFDGATWTNLATFDITLAQHNAGMTSDYNNELQGAAMMADGTIHLFIARSHDPSVLYTAFKDIDLFHVSMSTADVVSSLHLVEELIITAAQGNANGAMNRGGVADLALDESEIAFPYVYRENPDIDSGVGDIHVARGDLSTVLNPSWTIDSPSPANASEPVGYGDIPGGWNGNSLQCIYLCSNLQLYWRTNSPGVPSDNNYFAPGPPEFRLWGATRVSGTWSSPAVVYDPLSTAGAMSFHAIRIDPATDQVGISVDTSASKTSFTPANVAPTIIFATSQSPATCPGTTATLTLQKVVVNTHGGTAGPSDWAVRAIGPVTLSGSGTASSAGLPAGVYALSEGGPPGYSASAWVCVGGAQSGASITLAAGDDVTCTITNSDVEPPPPPPPEMCEPVTVTTPTPSLAAYNEATEKQGS